MKAFYSYNYKLFIATSVEPPMMEIAGVADFANMEGMLCTCMLFHSRYNRQASDVYKVAEQLKELAQQDTYNKIHIV